MSITVNPKTGMSNYGYRGEVDNDEYIFATLKAMSLDRAKQVLKSIFEMTGEEKERKRKEDEQRERDRIRREEFEYKLKMSEERKRDEERKIKKKNK